MIRHNLFTSNFKWNLKRLLGIIAAGILFLFVCRILNFLYVEEDERARIMWHNFYEQEENIDYICVGSSHVYSAVNPEILTQKTGQNYYNMATGGQRLRESYYIIKEADHRHRLKGIYLELYFVPSIEGQGNYDDFHTISSGWKNLDYRKLSFDKLDSFVHLNSPEYYIVQFFLLRAFENIYVMSIGFTLCRKIRRGRNIVIINMAGIRKTVKQSIRKKVIFIILRRWKILVCV